MTAAILDRSTPLALLAALAAMSFGSGAIAAGAASPTIERTDDANLRSL